MFTKYLNNDAIIQEWELKENANEDSEDSLPLQLHYISLGKTYLVM